MRDERGPWYLLTGVVLGVLLGLAYAWLISPLETPDTSPASLRAEFKDQYRALIASAYLANGNLERAKARLDLLGDADVARTLAEQAQRTLADGRSPREAQALGLLAVALGQGPPPGAGEIAAFGTSTGAPATTPSIAPAPETAPPRGGTATGASPDVEDAENGGGPADGQGLSATATPLPTRTPTPTPEALFVLQDSAFICDQRLGQPLIQVQASGPAGEPVPGVEVVVSWEGGEDHFFTGLKPELGLGYADFVMTPGVVYTLHLSGGGEPVGDLEAAECETSGGVRYWGSWLLTFGRP